MAIPGEARRANQTGEHGVIPGILISERDGVVLMDSGYALSWLWAIGLLGFAVGIASGLAVSPLLRGNRRRVEELERELAALHQQFDAYREQVNRHFLTTSELVQKMTDSYRDVYEHLAAGSAVLCQNPVTAPSLDFTRQPVVENLPHNPSSDDMGTEQSVDAEVDPLQAADSDTCMGDAPHVPHLETREPVSSRTPST